MSAQTQSKPTVSGIFQRRFCFGNIRKIYGTDTNILFFHYTTGTPVCQTPFYNFRTKTLCTNILYFRNFYGKAIISCDVFSIPLSILQKMTISLHFLCQKSLSKCAAITLSESFYVFFISYYSAEMNR